MLQSPLCRNKFTNLGAALHNSRMFDWHFVQIVEQFIDNLILENDIGYLFKMNDTNYGHCGKDRRFRSVHKTFPMSLELVQRG